jgi:hypothetical protein
VRRYTDLRCTDTGGLPTYAAIRSYILRRDGHTCQECGGVASEVDHIWPRRHGGDDTAVNLRAVCAPCNKVKGDSVEWHTATLDQLIAAHEAAADRALSESRTLAAIAGRLDSAIQAQLPSDASAIYFAAQRQEERAIAPARASADILLTRSRRMEQAS